MDIDISSFISVTPDVTAGGVFKSGKPLIAPIVPPIKEVLQGKVSPLLETAPQVADIAEKLINSNKLGTLVFISPELGRWSTVGGLGVMVDELTRGLASLGVDVTVISPYYERNRAGQSGYLAKDNIHWKR